MTGIYEILDISAQALTAYKAQANIPAENIANANRIDYMPKSLETDGFKQLINDLVNQESTSSDSASTQQAVKDLVFERVDKDIRLDDEIYLLNKAKGKYEAIAKMLNMKISLINTAIEGTR